MFLWLWGTWNLRPKDGSKSDSAGVRIPFLIAEIRYFLVSYNPGPSAHPNYNWIVQGNISGQLRDNDS